MKYNFDEIINRRGTNSVNMILQLSRECPKISFRYFKATWILNHLLLQKLLKKLHMASLVIL